MFTELRYKNDKYLRRLLHFYNEQSCFFKLARNIEQQKITPLLGVQALHEKKFSLQSDLASCQVYGMEKWS